MRFLTAIPVYNEEKYLEDVIVSAKNWCDDILIIDDGSGDGTPELLAGRSDVQVVRHNENRGYGAALICAFYYSITHGYDALVTMDCDGQHEPRHIPQLLELVPDFEIVSGSRYLTTFDDDSAPPEDRRRINMTITEELNQQLNLKLTDAFCGFKAYRTDALQRLRITEEGYAMPLQLWVQAAHLKFRIQEIAVPLIYLDASRAFGGSLDDSERRLNYYREVLDRSTKELPELMRTERPAEESSPCT